jgi:peptidoglycan hydrolase-like protein with peptidoglycan-binding domain
MRLLRHHRANRPGSPSRPSGGPQRRALIGGIVAAALALVGFGVLAASPASAADGWCTTSKAVAYGSDDIVLPTTSGGSINCLMVQGSQSAAVSLLQRAMNQCYAEGLSVDGQFGPRTAAALRDVQRRVHVDDDGEYGPITRHAMVWPSADIPHHCSHAP